MNTRESSLEEQSELGLAFKLHWPEGVLAEQLEGLIFLVHGRAGDFNKMWIFAKQPPQKKYLFISPQAPLPESIGGFSWWSIDGAGGGAAGKEELDFAVQKLEKFVQSACQYFSLPSNIPKLAIGFSQGSGTIATLALRQPQLFKGIALLAGFVPRIERNILPETRVFLDRGPRVFMASGLEDTIIPIAEARASRDYFQQCGFPFEYREDPVGHKVSSAGMKALREWYSEIPNLI